LEQLRLNMERYLNAGGSGYGTDGWIEAYDIAEPPAANDRTAEIFITEEGFYSGNIPKDPNYGARHGWSPTTYNTGYMHSGVAANESYCFYAKLEIPPKPTDMHYCATSFEHDGRTYCNAQGMNYKVCSNDS